MRLTLLILLVLLAASPAWAVKIADITHIGGERTNMLTGLGLVYGLDGTGDGGSFTAAINPLRQMLTKFSDPVQAQELNNAANVAVVALTATVPADGANNGDHLDVHVSSLGAATSLKGGRLFVTPMVGPMGGGKVLALAEGPVDLEDPSTPTVGVIRAAAGGAVMEESLPARVVDDQGRFTLIIDQPSASWTMASTIAQVINDSEGLDGQTLAVARGERNIVVTIPADERNDPDAFIARVEQLPVRIMPTQARVLIDAKTGTIIITGDVEISPVVISHKGLSISTINPPPVATPQSPIVTSSSVVELGTSHQMDGNLQDLITAMEQLKVPTADRIDILKELYESGKLHAKLIIDE
jgi:flagellar P-ring protein FlgI